MGCRHSTELAVPLVKYGSVRQEVIRFLPSLLTQGEHPRLPRPPKVISSNQAATKQDKEKAPKWKPPETATHNVVKPKHQPRSAPKQWTIVFVLGGPGCGKGTQCERIVRDFGFEHLSAGNLLREEVKKGTPVGQNCEKLMKEGKLVPLEITLGLLEDAMNSSSKTKFLIDGFPRAVDQAKAFEKKFGMPDKVLFLECPKSVMQERLLKRGEGRTDDNPATIMKRFDTFEKESLPVATYYESVNSSIIFRVSSVPAPDLVYKEIHGALMSVTPLAV